MDFVVVGPSYWIMIVAGLWMVHPAWVHCAIRVPSAVFLPAGTVN